MSFNTYWYLGLIVLSFLLFVYVIYQARNIRTIFLFMSMVGLAYLIEAVIYIFLGSYEYYPKFIQGDPYYDSNMGAIASNTFALPVTAVFISVLRIRWIGMILFALFFVGVEWLFLHLHIYAHHWWRYEFTAIGLPLYYQTAKVLYAKLQRPLRGFPLALLLAFMTGAVAGTVHITPIMLFSIRSYRPGWFADLSRDTTALSVVYYICISMLVSAVAIFGRKYRYLFYLAVPALVYAGNVLLGRTGILQSHVWWDTWFFTASSVFSLWIANAVGERLRTGPREQE